MASSQPRTTPGPDAPIKSSEPDAAPRLEGDELSASSDLARSLFSQGLPWTGFDKISKSEALRWAVEKSHNHLVRQLLDQKPDINQPDEDGWTCLHWAALGNNGEAVRLLVSRGASIDAQSTDGRFPLHIAADKGCVEALQVLLDVNADVECEDDDNWTPLYYACRGGHLEAVRLLIDRGALLSCRTDLGKTPLHGAAGLGRFNIVRQLVDSGADMTAGDNNGWTALHFTVLSNCLQTAQVLLDNDADIESRDKDGETPLAIAVARNTIEIASFLLKNNANTESVDDTGDTPLHLSVMENLRQMTQLLIENGANTEFRDTNNLTPLLEAARTGRIEVVRLLVDHGADVKATVEGKTGIHLATESQSKSLIRFFSEQGVLVDAKMQPSGETALMMAASKSNPEIVALLVLLGADVNASANDGQTPLHYAARTGCERIIEILLENAANPATETAGGLRPHHISTSQGHHEITKLLNESAPVALEGSEKSEARSVAALLLAAESGSLGRIMQLLDGGININSLDMDGRSSLSHAAERGWDDGVLALTKRNADLDLKDVNGGSPLWWASRYGHKAIVEHLLGEGAYIETVDADGQSSLSVSSQHGHLSTVKVLLQYGADPNSFTEYGKTVLLFAVTAGRMDVVEMLLDSGADVNYKNPHGVTALSLAEEHGYSNLVDVIRAHMERDTSESGARSSGHGELSTSEGSLNSRHELWLIEASRKGNSAMIRRLIMSAVDPNCCIDDETPLQEAAFYGEAEAAEVLIEHGADINVRKSDGSTALLLAADRGHTSIVSLLHRLGASFEEKDNDGCSALLRAACNGRETTTSVLLQLGANTESKDDEGGSPLWHASSNGHLSIVKLLLEYGANKECADASGLTPLMTAIEQRNLTVTRLLLHEGAQMRPESSQNYSPLCCAAEVGDEAIVDLLIDHGADLNYLSDNKRTALHIATLRGHIMVIRMLIEAGAKVDLRDADGRTALSLAKEAMNNSAVKVLCQASRLRQTSDRITKKTDEERLKRKASYQYQPLTKENSIRVIELHPGMPGDIIRFDLNEAQLNDNAFFEALSYEWRDKFGSVPVQCDDRQVLITPNCKEAMENLRLCSKPRYLWIDAICINQEDDQERNQQVAIMTDIFRAADKVLMWLGQETDSTRAAFDVLPIMAEAHHLALQAAEKVSLNPESVGEDNDPEQILNSVLQDEVVFDAFMDLIERTYWTRAWIFQEVALGGSRGVCISGSQYCDWTVLRSALLAFNDYPSTQHFSVIAHIADLFSNSGDVSLANVAWALYDLEATDPRDKIFAALGLAPTVKYLVERPTADYTMTVEEVYVHATRYIIDTEDVDEAWRLGIRQSDKAFPRLPSWVPDFKCREGALGAYTFKDSELLHGLEIVERPITTETSLEIGGCIVDKVVFKLTITGELDLYSILSCAISTVARQNHSIYDAYPVGKETMTDDGSEDAATPNEDEYRLPNRTNAKALLTTLLDFSKLSTDEENTMTEDMFHSIMIGFLTWALSRDTETPEQWNEAPSYAKQARKIWADKSPDNGELLEFELQNLKLMGDLLRYNSDLVFTENGYFGLTYGGQAEEGMVVALVGRDYKLRLLRNGAGPEGYYEYVDQVYLNFLGENRLEKVFGAVKPERLEFR